MKRDEHSNQRGNVMTVISDKIAPIDTTSDGLWDYFNPSLVSATDYYPFGMGMPGRNYNSTEYRYGHGTQEKTDEIAGNGNHYTARFWEYGPRFIRRWNVDPVVKIWQSGYVSYSNNPIWKVDPNGDDDYYNYAGKYVGSDNQKTTNIRLVSSKEAFNAYQKQGLEVLQGKTRIVIVQNNADEAINSIYTNSVNSEIEQKAYIILDTKNATLSIEVQPQDAEDKVNESLNKYKNYTRGGDKYKSPDGDDGNKVIVGQIHGHPGEELGRSVVPGSSSGDQQAAKDLGVPVYSVDRVSIYKVDQHGAMPDASCKDEGAPILQDALETYGGKPK